MILKPSCHITDVIRFISELDNSIFYNPLMFQGYIRDYYIGNKYVADDFIIWLNSLQNKIENSIISIQDIESVRLEGINASKKNKLQSKLFSSIYIDKDLRRIGNLETYIATIYGEPIGYDNKTIVNNTPNSLIISFSGGDEQIVEYGKLINFVWECNNPYRLCLSNGHENMDVTHIDSILISAIFDYYELILYNDEGKILDKKSVTIQYKNNAYCINCGNMYFDASKDNYCTKCGTKIFHDK